MAYSTAAQVKAVVDTDMADADVDELIAECDAFIDLEVPAGTAVLILRAISRTWAAYRVMVKDPSAERIADLSADRATNLKLMKEDYEDLLKKASGSAIVFKMVSDPIG